MAICYHDDGFRRERGSIALIVIFQHLSKIRLNEWRLTFNDIKGSIDQLILVTEKIDFADDDKTMIGPVKILLTSSKSPMEKRRDGFFAAAGAKLVVFVDEDVRPRQEDFQGWMKRALSDRRPVLWIGSYANPPGLGASGRTHNLLCNSWVERHSLETPRFLGGAFAISRGPRDMDLWSKITVNGGEEELFAASWMKNGGQFEFCGEFRPWHESRKSAGAFFLRACRHGRAFFRGARLNRRLGTKNFPTNLSTATGTQRLWIALHFSGLLVGCLSAGIQWGFTRRGAV